MTEAVKTENAVYEEGIRPDLSELITEMFSVAQTALTEAVENREEQQKHELAQFNCMI